MHQLPRHFHAALREGFKLCLLPLSRVLVEHPIWLADEVVLFPPESLNSEDFHVVLYPAQERRELERHGKILTPGRIEISGPELHWAKSAVTNIELEDFFSQALLAVVVDMDWDAFLAPESHGDHLDMISHAAAKAEAVLDLVRLHYCRIDVPEILPGRAGYLPEQGFTAALFYDLADHEAYIIAGQISTHAMVKGIGLDMFNVGSVETLGEGAVDNIVRHALRLHTSALEAIDDTSKFIQLMTLIECLADPDAYLPMHEVKKKIARHAAKNRPEYDAIIADFRYLTKGEAPNEGLRHNIVHLGKRLEDLLDGPGRVEVLQRLWRYACVALDDLIALGDEDWAAVEAFRRQRGVDFGLESDTKV